jgi:predicted RNase H-like HicB family nuclease
MFAKTGGRVMKDTATCYAWVQSGNWEAICVDYDLTAQGDSLEEVRRELDDAIETFLSRVRELPKSEQARLLNRKAPLALRTRLAVLYRLSRLLTLMRIRLFNRHSFHTPVGLTPAA